MKITFFSDAYEIGGAEFYIRILIDRLLSHGHNVSLAIPHNSNTEFFIKELLKKNIEVFNVPTTPRKFLKSIINSYSFFKNLDADLVHFVLNNPESCNYPIFISKMYNIKSLATGQLIYNPPQRKYLGLRRRFKLFIISKKFHALNRLIAVSYQNAKILNEIYNVKKVDVVYNAIDINKYKYNLVKRNYYRNYWKIAPDEILIGIIGRLSSQKGHQYFLNILPRLIKKYNIKAIFVGDGELRKKYEKFILNNSLQSHVILAGYQKDIAGILSALDIFLLPSIREGLPFSIIEAMAVGVPVICTDVGGIPEIVKNGETGILIPSRNSEIIFKNIEYLIKNNKLRTRLIEKAKLYVEKNFSIDNMYNKTLDIYFSLLKE